MPPLCVCRKMYDAIVQESPLLPNGVDLPEVLEGAADSEVAEVLASMPPPGERISVAALDAAGGNHTLSLSLGRVELMRSF